MTNHQQLIFKPPLSTADPEKILREIEQKLALIFSYNPTAMAIVSFADGCFIEVNESFLRLLGYEREEVIGHMSAELDVWVDRTDRAAVVEELKQKETVVNVKTAFKARSGAILAVLLSATVLDLFGKKCLVYVFNDITEHQEVKESLRRTASDLRAVFEALPDVFLRLNAGGVVLDYRKGSAASHIIPFAVKRNIYECLPAAVAVQYEAALDTTIRTKSLTEIEYHLSQNGHDHFFEARFLPYYIETQAIVIVRDVTERKRMEAALAQERNLLLAVINNCPDFIFVKDNAGRYVLSNKAHLQRLGAQRLEDIVGKTVFDFLPTSQAMVYSQDDEMVISTGQPIINREEFVPEARHWYITTKIPVRDQQGTVRLLAGISRDVTALKQKELELQAAREDLEHKVVERTSELMQTERKLLELYKYLGVVNRHVSILLTVNKKGRNRNAKKVISFIVDAAKNLSGARVIALYRYARRSLHLMAHHGLDTATQKETMVLTYKDYSFLRPLVRKVRVQGTTASYDLKHLDAQHACKYFLAVPIIADKKLAGMLFFGFADREDITTQELEFFEAFAAQSSLALYDALKAR